jgi:hypothetical protein
LKKIEVILTECIKEIKSGQATIKQCLERYPAVRRELEPLLKMALDIQEPPPFQLDPAYKQSARARLLGQIRTTKQANSRSWSDVFSFGLPRQMVWARAAAAVVTGLIVISALGSSAAYASQSSLPGELLYPIKTETENIRLWMAGSSSDKAELNLEFSQKRLGELAKLSAGHSAKTGLAVTGYRKDITAAQANLQGITDNGSLERVLEKFSQKLADQILYCENLVDAGPEDSQSVQQAAAAAVDGQIDILTRLAQLDNLMAAQLNLDMMQARLQRARTKAGEQQYQLMQEAILAYQQFDKLGLQILQNAQSTQNNAAEIDNLNSMGLNNCLETLETIAQEIPSGFQEIIKTTQDLTIQFQKQASYGGQPQGETGGGSQQGPNTPKGNDSGNSGGPGPSPTSPTPGGTGNTGNNPPDVTPTPTPTTGGSGPGDPNTGGNGMNQPDTTPAPTPDSGGNTGSGNGTGPGSGTGPGGGSNPASDNTTGSAGGGNPK